MTDPAPTDILKLGLGFWASKTLLSAVSLGLAGAASGSFAAMLLLQAAIGVGLGMASAGLIAVAPTYYAVRARARGVGWAMGSGRVGSFLGPVVMTSLVARGLPTAWAFGVMAVPVVAAVLLLLFLPSPSRDAGLPLRAGRDPGP